jgi:phospholipid/cholesterol/gamma-HCH transport system substrate-binding protein
MSRRRTTRLAAVAATCGLLLSGCGFSVYDLPLPGGADVGDDPYEVKVMFRDVLDLVPKSAVKVNDISVGRVEEVEVQDFHAELTLVLNKDVKLPDNAVAEIRQTSLLGEKFVQLAPPESNPSSERLGDGDVIDLERSGRNPELEEVLGALSLVLNGGGVGQLKLITNELNKTFEGREGTIKSVLSELDTFMTQLDGRKQDIVEALEAVNDLSVSLNRHTDDLDLALEELPSAIASVDRQRNDLVKMLRALSDLSSVGTRVIAESKDATIRSLELLAPTLTQLAKSGDNVAQAFQMFLTYPFLDAVVGENPQEARDLHMGDYTNLSIDMDINLDRILSSGFGLPNGEELPSCASLDEADLGDACRDALGNVTRLTRDLLGGLTGGGDDGGGLLGGLTGGRRGGGGGGGGQGGEQGGGLLGDLLGRAAVGAQQGSSQSPLSVEGVDRDLAAMLVWGAMPR